VAAHPARRRAKSRRGLSRTARLLIAVVLVAMAGCADGSSRRTNGIEARDQARAATSDQAGDQARGNDPRRRLVVSTNGDDGATGTAAEPWRTLGAALHRLRPGDLLLVRGGRYRERIIDVAVAPATETDPIRVQPWPGEEPILQGLLWLRGPDYWAIEGLRITWDPDADSEEHMVKLVDGVGWTFSENELWGARSYAALLVAGETDGQPADWRVSGNCVHDTHETNDANQDQLIYVNTGLRAGQGVIERNILFGAPNGAGIKLGGPSEREGGAVNVTVRRNTIAFTAQSMLVSWGSKGNRIEDNLLYGVGEGYGNIRGYELEGRDNVVAGNAGGGARLLILNDDGHEGLVDGGDNRFPVEPRFRSEECSGFEPAATEARRYGARS